MSDGWIATRSMWKGCGLREEDRVPKTSHALLLGVLLATACGQRPLPVRRDAAAPMDMRSANAEVLHDVALPVYRKSTLHFVEIAGSGGVYCGITTEATVECWGSHGQCRDREGECLVARGCVPKPTSGSWRNVSVDLGDGCAIDADDRLACWGCGKAFPAAVEGRFSAVYLPYAIRKEDSSLVLLGQGWPAVYQPPSGGFLAASGFRYYCGLRMDQTLVCWGVYGLRWDPVPPPAGTFTQVAVGGLTGCALQMDGRPICWGNTDSWESGGPSWVPLPGGTFKQIAGNGAVFCGVRSDGGLACWGPFGEFPPPSEGQYLQVAVAETTVCALRADGIVVCWGSDDEGESAPP